MLIRVDRALARQGGRCRRVSRGIRYSLFALTTQLGMCPLPAAAVDCELAITSVTVIPMDRERVMPEQNLQIAEGRIAHIQSSASDQDINCDTVIDGAGSFLIPALTDMHVHIGEPWGARGSREPGPLHGKALADVADELYLYVANGVMQVRNMDGRPFHLDLRERIAKGEMMGPDIVTAGPIVFAPGLGALYDSAETATGAWVETAEDGKALVETQLAAGYDFIKVYNAMPPEAYTAIVDTARAHGAQVAGHVPYSVGIWGALAARQDSIEHLRGYDFDPHNPPVDPLSTERFAYWHKVSDEKMQEYAEATASAGVSNTTTQIIAEGIVFGDEREAIMDRPNYEYVSRALRQYMRDRAIFSDAVLEVTLGTESKVFDMIRALNEAGARVMAGSDTPVFFTIPGFSIHGEIRLYVDRAGMTPYEALKAATANPADYLGQGHERGRVKEGFLANLILIRDNPLENIENTADIEGVVVRGKWIGRTEIDQQLKAIADRHQLP